MVKRSGFLVNEFLVNVLNSANGYFDFTACHGTSVNT